MLSSEIKALISAAVELYSTVPLTQALIDEGTNKLTKAKELLLSQKEEPSEKQYKTWLLNPLFAENLIENAFVNAVTGNQQTQTKYKCTDFIEIPEGVKTISVVDSLSGVVGGHVFAVYDKNKNFIKGSYKNSNYDWNFDIPKNSEFDHVDFNMPDNAKYIRFNSSSSGNICGAYYLSDTPEIIEFIHNGNESYLVDTINELKFVDAKAGDVITTKGYNSVNDAGQATYDIMTYDEFYYNLPDDIKLISVNNNFVKTPVDEYGNHTLNNGLVAKLRLTGETTPEQWGAVAQESFNSCQAFVHMFAHIKTGKIKLKKDGVYCLGLIYKEDTINSFKDNPYKTFMTGNLLGGQFYSKPIMANIHGVEFIGDNTTITIPKNVFGNNGMGILNFGGKVDGLKIKGINFDGKGRCCNYPNKNSNHTIFYTPATISSNHPAIKDIHPLLCVGSLESDKGSFKNFEVTSCSFKDAGATYKKAGDYGGDFILVINPTVMDNVNIHHNRFESWGRWVFAVDLGGNGECMTNVKFNDNVCIGANACKYLEENYNIIKDENNKTEYILQTPDELKINPSLENSWRWRGLGFIDYEAKKCWKNMELQRNLIVGSAGWAINGSSRISEDFLIKDNIWLHQGGGYPYLIEFYSGFAKNWLIENNIIPGGGCKMGLTSENITIRNNKGNIGFRMFGLQGDIIFESNKKLPNDGMNYHKMLSLEGTRRPDYLPDSIEQKAKLTFKNNEYGLVGDRNYNVPYLEFDICNNKIDWIDIHNFYHKDFGANDFSVWINGIVNYHGFHLLEENNKPGLNPFGTYYKEGEVICSSVKNKKLTAAITTYWNHDILTEDQYNILKLTNNYQHLIGKEIGGVKYSDFKIVCTKSGIIPSITKYGFRQQMSDWRDFIATGNKLQDNAYIHYEDNLYRNIGATGVIDAENPPIHTQGIATCGEVQLEFIDKIGMAKLIGIE